MTDKKTEALKLALEALEWIAAQRTGGMIQRKAMEAITALREALVEQPAQQEPVTDTTYNYAKSLAEVIFKQHFASDEHYASGRIVWGVNDTVIGILTQIDNMMADMVRRPAQHEPVEWMITTEMQDGRRETYPSSGRYKDVEDSCDFGEPVPLYTSPPASKPWVGLTREDKVEILRANGEAAVLILTEAKLRDKNA